MSLLLSLPGVTHQAVASGATYSEATITNPTGTITDFSLIVDLSTLPASWWSTAENTDATRGRAYKGTGTELACDWIDYNHGANTGWLRVKWSGNLTAAGSDSLRVEPPTSGNATVAASATYGSDNAYDANWVGYWPLTDLNDRTSNSNDLTANGGVTVGGITGKVGSATDYDNTDDYHSVANPLTPSSGFTAMLWAYPDSLAEDQRAFGQWDAPPDSDQSWFIWMDAGGSGDGWGVVTFNDPAITAIGSDDSNATASTWQHVAVRFDPAGSNTLDIRVNNGTPTSNTSATSPTDTSNANLTIGAFYTPTSSTQCFNGRLDDVQLHSAVRSADWIAKEYAQTNNNAGQFGTWSAL